MFKGGGRAKDTGVEMHHGLGLRTLENGPPTGGKWQHVRARRTAKLFLLSPGTNLDSARSTMGEHGAFEGTPFGDG